ncbi:MAG: hypothetical protein FD175_1950 [Beijerinckiaceae bacterium]|nr:MAG: hypothetical protein FD175_1950 [Beijerinckiaceae bacterium]
MMKTFLSRRALAAGLIGAPAGALALNPVEAILPAAKPVREDLTRYYAFLWHEFRALEKELGIEPFCSRTAHCNGDVEALTARLVGSPSERALNVLTAAHADRRSIFSEAPPLFRGGSKR